LYVLYPAKITVLFSQSRRVDLRIHKSRYQHGSDIIIDHCYYKTLQTIEMSCKMLYSIYATYKHSCHMFYVKSVVFYSLIYCRVVLQRKYKTTFS